ncbi:transcription factor HES-7.1-B-like [Anoplopoma fimbria]|uniref:transcription factor HES-7.1-B-like n=1 Tax=Anoplopoma fimbria TaxID=229290 RepID=UPI0023EB5495|nr:transcription factor HES-7.1-B-like [Anoplopoma fimbria]
MKLHQDSEATKEDRKSLKPQVERRRRERMNRSLESLKTLLLQQQETCQRRVEKAEILEHTVLFLQNTVERNTMRAEGGGGGGGGQKHSFQDGFSTCLQTAARFLGPDGKGLRLGEALDASRSDSAGVLRRTASRSSSSSLLLMKSSRSILRLLIQKSGHRLCTPVLTTVPSCVQTRVETQSSDTSTPQHPHREASQSASQSLWRPWP